MPQVRTCHRSWTCYKVGTCHRDETRTIMQRDHLDVRNIITPLLYKVINLLSDFDDITKFYTNNDVGIIS